MDEYLMTDYASDAFNDVHQTLMPYSEVLAFFENLERSGCVKSYCNGSNATGRWIFQIYSREFITELALVINRVLQTDERSGPIIEVMSGDGRLTEFLRPLVQREIIATDAKDGRYNIAYPKWVEKLDAIDSIDKYSPSFIIMSWEPYLSMTGLEMIRKGIPMAWIGNPEMCGHPDIFEVPYLMMKSKYLLSRHDSFIKREFKTGVFLFNCNQDCLEIQS
jgi:hypothetical protein